MTLSYDVIQSRAIWDLLISTIDVITVFLSISAIFTRENSYCFSAS